jgi:zinc protease
MISTNINPTVGRFTLAIAAAVMTALALLTPAHAIEIQQVTSPLGLKAWLVEDHSVQLFSMNYAFTGGSSQEPADKRGIANMLVSLLDEGAGNLDSKAFQTKLEDQSISMGFNSDRDNLSGSLRAITDDRDTAIQLLTLALTAPRFDAEPVDRIRSGILLNIRNRDRNPTQQANAAFNAALFPGHIYGVPAAGTADTVNSITVADLRAFQKRMMARDNLKIVAVGDLDPKTLGAMIDAIFGTLPEHADLTPVANVAPPQAKFIDVTLPGAAQTSLSFAGPAPLRSDPDYLAAYVAAFILGGGNPGTRLYDAIRIERGLTYSIGLGLDVADHAGWFIGTTSTRADQADQVLQLVKDEIKRYADEGPTADELASAKAYLIGSYPLRFVTTGQEASQLMGVLTGNLGIDYINERNDMIAAITLDDVKREAKRLFGGDMLISRVGPAS